MSDHMTEKLWAEFWKGTPSPAKEWEFSTADARDILYDIVAGRSEVPSALFVGKRFEMMTALLQISDLLGRDSHEIMSLKRLLTDAGCDSESLDRKEKDKG